MKMSAQKMVRRDELICVLFYVMLINIHFIHCHQYLT